MIVLRIFYLHNIVIRMNASKYYSMQASHNELSSAILQRHVLDTNPSMLEGLNLLDNNCYTTILLYN